MKNFNFISFLLVVSQQSCCLSYDSMTKTLIFEGELIETISKEDFEKHQETEVLIISRTSLRCIPDCVSLLDKVTTVLFTNNKCVEDISNLILLKRIRSLELTSNNITTLPAGLQKLKNLRYLGLNNNNITVFPEIILELDNLDDLDLSHNRIDGIPDEISNLTRLRIMNCSHNHLECLPFGISILQNLQNLNLDHNRFNLIPIEVCVLTSLKKLSLQQNNISAMTISSKEVNDYCQRATYYNKDPNSKHYRMLTPVKHFKSQYLKWEAVRKLLLRVSKSQCYHIFNFNRNTVSLGLLNLINLEKLDLSKNRISIIPDDISTLQKLQVLLLSENKIKDIPTGIANMSCLRTIDLSSNKITSVPTEILESSNDTEILLCANYIHQHIQDRIILVNNDAMYERIKLGYQNTLLQQ